MTQRPWGSLAIVTRLFDGADPIFFNSWSALIADGIRSGDVVMSATVRMAAHQAANTIVRQFLTDPALAHCDSLFTVDCDHAFDAGALEQLRTDPAGQTYDVLGGLYIARVSQYPLVLQRGGGTDDDPEFRVADSWSAGDVVPVDLMGLGFTLFRRQVLEALADPWFWYLQPTSSEDVAFCRSVQRAGFRMGVATGVMIGHVALVDMRPVYEMVEEA